MAGLRVNEDEQRRLELMSADKELRNIGCHAERDTAQISNAKDAFGGCFPPSSEQVFVVCMVAYDGDGNLCTDHCLAIFRTEQAALKYAGERVAAATEGVDTIVYGPDEEPPDLHDWMCDRLYDGSLRYWVRRSAIQD